MRHRAIMIALFVMAVLAATVTMSGFWGSAANAQNSTPGCDISQFVNPDKTLDTTGYLACVAAATAGAPQPGPDCPTADLLLLASAEPSTVSVGQSTNFSATGFAPGSNVECVLCSTPVLLGAGPADGSGNVNQTFQIPSGTSLGAHTIACSGARANGIRQVAYAPINVVGQGSTISGSLPTTGSDNGKLIAFGAALIVLGGAAVFGSARARRPATVESD